MKREGDGRRRRWILRNSAAVLVLMMLFGGRLEGFGRPARAAEEETNAIARYSVVVVNSGQDLPALANRYGTTVAKIEENNAGVLPIKKGTVLTIKENTVRSAKSRGGVTSRWFWPLTGTITSAYGERAGGFHHGIDIAAWENEKVKAAQGGIVVKARWFEIYGLAVLVDHGSGIQTLYAHNNKLLVKPGDVVKAGDALALAGSTGESTGPHVHFEIRLNGRTIDPTLYLPRTQIVAD